VRRRDWVGLAAFSALTAIIKDDPRQNETRWIVLTSRAQPNVQAKDLVAAHPDGDVIEITIS
jgi:hypothetical protein